ncbi:MAG: hypothetical protein RL731_210, partial [Bacteroidota bacterium]
MERTSPEVQKEAPKNADTKEL